MSIKVGDKFVIEIGTIAELPDGKKKYFIKPFESLVFDRKGLEQLEPVGKAWENELEKAKLFAYKNGFEHGKKIADKDLKEIQDSTFDVAYNEALKDAEMATRYFYDTDKSLLSISEKVRLWKEEKKKAEDKTEEEPIKAGDIVKFNEKCHRYDQVKLREYLVLHVFEDRNLATILYDNGDTSCVELSLVDKTGRHIDGVSQLLDKLRGKNND